VVVSRRGLDPEAGAGVVREGGCRRNTKREQEENRGAGGRDFIHGPSTRSTENGLLDMGMGRKNRDRDESTIQEEIRIRRKSWMAKTGLALVVDW
jgi:hypothetical protein